MAALAGRITCRVSTLLLLHCAHLCDSEPLPPPFVLTPEGIGLSIPTPLGPWLQPLPLELQTVSPSGAVTWTRGPYATLRGATATGTLAAPSGATFLFTDTLSNTSLPLLGFTLRREVEVLSLGSGGDAAFATQFSLPAPPALWALPRDLFVPGVAYQNASALPPGALAGDPRAAHVLIREDRLPLPLAQLRFPGAAGAAQLLHLAPTGGTFPGEDFAPRLIDARLQFGSLGVLNGAGGAVSLAFQFPGSEGDRTYVYPPAAGWANRSHPVARGVPHAYALQVGWREGGAAGSFYEAARAAWRGAFADFAPAAPPPRPPPGALYRAGAELLAAYGVPRAGGVPAIPFEARLPDGVVTDASSQMGFVGRALPCAALLLYDAVVALPNATRAAQAGALLDVWAAHAPTPCGTVRTWFNILPSGALQWRPADPYQGSLRIMCDGMKGLLDAWAVAPTPGNAGWLRAAVGFADFLVRAQGPDGSLASAYDWDCAPLAADARHTPFAIPFLAAAHAATGDPRYRAAALAAGAFSAALFADAFVYAGGAVDNPDVPDREAGWLCAQAFLALFDLTGDAAWLAPAARAATFAETFTYAWEVPIPCAQAPPPAFPCARTTLGASLVATGQSGADNFMAVSWHDLRRLGLALGDAHFLAVADFLEGAAGAVTDWDGALGYAAPGLLHEAATLSARRGEGVSSWLPWLTANILQPFVQQQMNSTMNTIRR